jgi:DNA-directed RNA polymerase specialized sigma24 family protein
MINIEEHRKWVFVLLERASIPSRIKDDVYQDFCVYYYSQNSEYDSQYSITTWIGLLFRSFLSHRAAKWSMKKRQAQLVGVEFISELGYDVDYEASVDVQRLYKKLPPMFKTLLNTNKTPKIMAEEEGVTRQAIESRLKRLMAKATEDYVGEYA